MKKNIKQFFIHHKELILVSGDYISKFLTVVSFLFFFSLIVFAVENIFFLNKIELGIFQFFTATYYLLMKLEEKNRKTADKLLEIHRNTIRNLLGIIHKIASGATSVSWEEKQPQRKKNRLLN